MIKREITRKNFVPNRDEYILEKVKSKKVLHIGACDWPFTEKKLNNNSLLFKKIDSICQEQLGIDLDKDSINFLKSQNFEKSDIIEHDMNTDLNVDFKPDVIIFGETLEHLTNLGIALDNLKRFMREETELVISVPNSTYFRHFIYALFGNEHQHPDHSASFSYKTLKQLLEKKDLAVNEFLFTFLSSGTKNLNWKGKLSYYITRPLGSIFPMLSANLLVSVKLKK